MSNSKKTLFATAAVTIDDLYDTHGITIWWVDEHGVGDFIEFQAAMIPTIIGREIDPETGEVLDEGKWDLDEAEDMIRDMGYTILGQQWDDEPFGDDRQPRIEIERV